MAIGLHGKRCLIVHALLAHMVFAIELEHVPILTMRHCVPGELDKHFIVYHLLIVKVSTCSLYIPHISTSLFTSM